MVAGLLVAGICTALIVNTTSYWQLVAVLWTARLAFTMYTVPSAAVTPEAFGNSRWARAGVAVSVGGVVVGLSIRITAIATWDQSKPATWAAAYYLSAAYIVIAAIAIAVLAREAPVAKKLAKKAGAKFSDTIRSVLEQPNAKLLLLGIFFAIASGGAFSRAYPIYADEVLGAGGDTQSAGLLGTAVLSIASFPLSWILAHKIKRRNLALWAGVAGAASAVAHIFITEFWQSVLVQVGSQVFLVASVLALAPFYLRILPRGGGLGERIGVILSPILITQTIAAFGSAALYDWAVHDLRIIWVPTAVFGLISGVLIWRALSCPEGHELAHPGRMFNQLKDLLWGDDAANRKLFSGELGEHEVDGTELLDLVSDELNPYHQRA